MRIPYRSSILFVAALAAALPGPAFAKTISLNGDWNFLADPARTLDVRQLSSATNVRPTRVPSSWQPQFTDLRDYAGVAWYWRSVNIDPPAPDQVVLLRFGAVDYRADVYVNGQKVGSHEGGYLPFEFDITPQVHSGENMVAVRVADAGANPRQVEGIRYEEIPHGKQNWYVQTSGLWQGVELDLRPRAHLGTVHVSAGADGLFRIAAAIASAPTQAQAAQGLRLDAEILDAGDKVVWKESQGLKPGQARCEFTGRLATTKLWSLDSPSLYTLRATLSNGDVVTTRFGFRTFETRNGKFYLNGRQVYLRGALDQDFYPETVYTPPSLDYVKDEMGKAKALGLNLLRCHIKVPDPRYLDAADETGIFVWYEIPNWDKLTGNAEVRALATLRGMVERDWNHPSIVIVSIINESWGANLKEPGDRAWLKGTYTEAKSIVPGWLVVDNSACCDNFHMASDIADFHHYNAIPDYAEDFDRFVADLATRPGWIFSPYGDVAPKGDEPLMLSEFGNWGLPRLPEDKPWWFTRDFNGNKITLPDGVEKRFQSYHYGSLFADPKALSDATEWHEYLALKYEIESLRAQAPIQGYVITEFTDVNWESNGLMDMWRKPKVFADLLSKLQKDDLVMLRAARQNFTSEEKAEADIYFSRYSSGPLGYARVTWWVEGTGLRGIFPMPPAASGSVVKAGKIEFTVPAVRAPSKNVLKVRVTADGQTLTENSLDFFFFPARRPDLPPPASFHDPGGRLRRLFNEMRARNYLAPTGSEAFPVLVASVFDDVVKNNLRAGGRVILIPSDRMVLAPGIEVVPRAGSSLDGNWISSFSWIRKGQDPFKLIGFDTLTGFEAQAVTPSAVVQGVPPENFSDVLAGIFYGWIHSNVGTLVQAKAGKGKMLICTYSLATTYGSDPYATSLLDSLVNYIVTGPPPVFEIPLTNP